MDRVKSFGRLLVPLLILPVLAACGYLFPDDEELVQRARDYLQEDSYNSAAIELRNALQTNPQNAEARYLLGTITLNFGDYATATKEFRKAREVGWDEVQAQAGLARALLGSGDFAGLLDEIQARDSYPPTAQAELLALSALAEAGLGNQDRAGELLEEATVLDADGLQVLVSTIKIQFAAGQEGQARKTLQAALEQYPEDPDLLLLHARLAVRDGNAKEAIETYRKVIAFDPPGFTSVRGREARLGLAMQQIQSRDFEQAEATIGPLLRRDSKDPSANYLGGMLAFERGDLDLAEERVFKVLQQAPNYSPAHLLFATVSYSQANYEQAAYYLSKYLASNPGNKRARKLLGRAYMQLGQPENARTTLRAAEDDTEDDAELLALIGMSELQGGDAAAGITTLERAVKTAPQNTSLRNELAKAYLEAGETNRAISELEALLAEDGDQDRSRALLIIARLRAGQNDQAINLVLDMLGRKPEDPVIMTMAGSVFAISGDRQEARKYFTGALRLRPQYVPATMALAHVEELDGNIEAARTLYTGLVEPKVKSAAALLALAHLAKQQDRDEEMVGWLVKAVEFAPEDVTPRIRLADYYLQEGLTDKAAPFIREALRMEPKNPQVLALQGRAMLAEKRYTEALVPLGKLVTRVPDSALARTLLAECHIQLDQAGDARRQLEIALQKQPYFVPALVLMATLDLKSGDYDRALELSRRARQADPQNAATYELDGNVWMAKRNYASASDAYSRAWERQQSSGLAIKLARVMSLDNRPGEAVDLLETWLAGQPGDIRVRQLLGTLYQRMGRVDEAMGAYETVLATEPDNPVVLNNLAGLYLDTGNPESMDMGKRAYQASPDNPGVMDTYGWILVRHEQAAAGLELLKQAMVKLSEVPEVRYHYAVALLKTDRETEARQLLAALIESGKPFAGRDEAERLLGN